MKSALVIHYTRLDCLSFAHLHFEFNQSDVLPWQVMTVLRYVFDCLHSFDKRKVLRLHCDRMSILGYSSNSVSFVHLLFWFRLSGEHALNALHRVQGRACAERAANKTPMANLLTRY